MALLKQQLVRGVAGQAGNVFDTIVTFLTDTPGTPGRDWEIHADYRASAGNVHADYQYNRVVLKNTGKSDNEEIYIGIQAAVQPTGVRAGIDAGLVLKTYYQFDNTLVDAGLGKYNYATNFYNSTYGSAEGNYATRCWVPFKTDESTSVWADKPPLELWVFSNKARIIIVINTEQRFANGYAGQYIRHVTPQEVPYPLCCLSDSFNGGNSSQSEALWYTYLTYDTIDFGGPQNYGRYNLIFVNHGNWSWSSISDKHFACNRFMTPAGWTYDWHFDPTMSASNSIVTTANINYPDGGFEQLLFPIYIYAYTASQQDYYLLGQLDGVYWAPNIANTSLTEIGSGDCIVFPNLNRTSWHSWMALKDEL